MREQGLFGHDAAVAARRVQRVQVRVEVDDGRRRISASFGSAA